MNFEHLPSFGVRLPEQLYFGRGALRQHFDVVAAVGRRTVFVHGSRPSRLNWLMDDLEARGMEIHSIACGHEPSLVDLRRALAQFEAVPVDAVIMAGGGSVLDFGKALAALLPSGSDPMEHLEVVGEGKPLKVAPLPSVAIPTTAGTGSEVTCNAVISVPSRQVKVSLRDMRMLPKVAIVDPQLTDYCPKSVTLASGLDAITQAIEAYLCTGATPLTDALCRTAIPSGMRGLVRLMDAEDPSAREQLALCSLFGGIALANAGLGAVHGLAGPIGGLTHGAHGTICGALLPHVLAANEKKANAGVGERIAYVRMAIAQAMPKSTGDALSDLSVWSRMNGLPSLKDLGLAETDFDQIAHQAKDSSSMRKNPVPLSLEDLCEILANERA